MGQAPSIQPQTLVVVTASGGCNTQFSPSMPTVFDAVIHPTEWTRTVLPLNEALKKQSRLRCLLIVLFTLIGAWFLLGLACDGNWLDMDDEGDGPTRDEFPVCSTTEQLGTYRTPFAVFLAIAVVGLFLSCVRKRRMQTIIRKLNNKIWHSSLRYKSRFRGSRSLLVDLNLLRRSKVMRNASPLFAPMGDARISQPNSPVAMSKPTSPVKRLRQKMRFVASAPCSPADSVPRQRQNLFVPKSAGWSLSNAYRKIRRSPQPHSVSNVDARPFLQTPPGAPSRPISSQNRPIIHEVQSCPGTPERHSMRSGYTVPTLEEEEGQLAYQRKHRSVFGMANSKPAGSPRWDGLQGDPGYRQQNWSGSGNPPYGNGFGEGEQAPIRSLSADDSDHPLADTPDSPRMLKVQNSHGSWYGLVGDTEANLAVDEHQIGGRESHHSVISNRSGNPEDAPDGPGIFDQLSNFAPSPGEPGSSAKKKRGEKSFESV